MPQVGALSPEEQRPYTARGQAGAHAGTYDEAQTEPIGASRRRRPEMYRGGKGGTEVRYQRAADGQRRRAASN